MSKNQYNELRCYACEIIIKLYHAKEIGQLEELKAYLDIAIEKLKEQQNEQD